MLFLITILNYKTFVNFFTLDLQAHYIHFLILVRPFLEKIVQDLLVHQEHCYY